MSVSRSQILTEFKSLSEPKLVHEGNFPSDTAYRVFTNQGGYHVETDEYLIDGPFEMSEDEYEETLRLVEEDDTSAGYWELSEEHIRMVEAGCEPEVQYYRYQIIDQDEIPMFSEDSDELEQILIDDVLKYAECQPWDEMSDAELDEWYAWFRHLEE